MRGVSTSYTLRKLLARDLIKVCGKSDLPGKPNLYTITNTFLDYFGLATLNDLPKFESLAHEDEEELYTTIFKENVWKSIYELSFWRCKKSHGRSRLPGVPLVSVRGCSIHRHISDIPGIGRSVPEGQRGT